MVLAALITADQRLAQQIQAWMKDLSESVRLETYANLDKFTPREIDPKKLPKTPQPVAATPAPSDESMSAVAALAAVNEKLKAENAAKALAAEKKIEPYRLLIVDAEYLSHEKIRIATWAGEIKEYLRKLGLSNPELPVKILIVSFGSGSLAPDKLRDQAIDDLLIKPLERDIFLQKVELLCSDKPGAQHSFLFRQSTKIPIEVGKDAIIEELSEFAVALCNPHALHDGVFAVIHSAEIFGTGTFARAIARVYKSEPHPTVKGSFLVRLTFFGINHEQLNNVRKYMKTMNGGAIKVPKAKSSAKSGTAASSTKKGADAAKKARVAIIDMDRDTCSEIRSALEGTYQGVDVQTFPSWGRFVSAFSHLMPVSADSSEKPAGHVQADTAASDAKTDQGGEVRTEGELNAVDPSAAVEAPIMHKFTILLSPDRTLLSIENQLEAGAAVLGSDLAKWMQSEADWHRHIAADDAKEADELIEYVKSGGKGQGYWRIKNSTGAICYFEVSAKLVANPSEGGQPLVQISLIEMESASWMLVAPQVQAATSASQDELNFEVIFIEVGMIRADVQSWYESLHNILEKVGLASHDRPMPKVFLMASKNSHRSPDECLHKGIFDFLYKPIDRRELIETMRVMTMMLPPGSAFVLRDDAEPLVFNRCEIYTKLAKAVVMDEIAEYGLSILLPAPLREGVFLRFFSPLLDGQGDGLLGRCTHYEKIEGDKENVRVYFSFFGPNEEALKRIRNWIKEDYVHRKEGASGS